MRRFLVGAVGVALAFAVALLTSGSTFDFGLDWLVARALVTGVDPHQPMGVLAEMSGVSIEGGGHFIAPRTPAAMLLQAPVGWIPMEYGYQAGRLLTVGSFAGLMWVVARIARIPVHWPLLAMPALLFVWPFSVVLEFSQTSFMVAALIGLTWLFATRSDRWVAGLPLAVAVAFKMWPWLLIPALWLAGYRKTALGAAGGFVGLNLAGLALPNVTLSGTVAAMTGAQTLETWSIMPNALVAVAVGLVGVLIVSRFARPESTVMWAIPIALVTAPVLWSHYLVALMVPLAAVYSVTPYTSMVPDSKFPPSAKTRTRSTVEVSRHMP